MFTVGDEAAAAAASILVRDRVWAKIDAGGRPCWGSRVELGEAACREEKEEEEEEEEGEEEEDEAGGEGGGSDALPPSDGSTARHGRLLRGPEGSSTPLLPEAGLPPQPPSLRFIAI